ncbi:MAG: hypothetical protein LBE23_12585, partial [Vagococcus sp.]|nr:hypothetical protein [Vagococcus sp.]
MKLLEIVWFCVFFVLAAIHFIIVVVYGMTKNKKRKKKMIDSYTKFFTPSALTLILSLWTIGLSDISKTDKSVFKFLE